MALGYVVAVVLEAAALVGLVIGFVRLRAEKRAVIRAAELRGLLLTGSSNAAAGFRPAAHVPAPRRVVVETSSATVAQDGLSARAALERALDTLRQVDLRQVDLRQVDLRQVDRKAA